MDNNQARDIGGLLLMTNKHLCVLVEALTCWKISDSFFGESSRTHDFDDVEASPADVVAQHLQVGQLCHGVGLDSQIVLAQFL